MLADFVADMSVFRMELGEVVPQLLQPDGRLLVSIAPEEIDHLAVETHLRLAPALPALFDQAADDRAELLPVGFVADEERRERVPRIEQRQLPGDARAVETATAQPESVDQRPSMRLGGDEDDRFTGGESGGGETGYGVVERAFRLVKRNWGRDREAATEFQRALPILSNLLGTAIPRS